MVETDTVMVIDDEDSDDDSDEEFDNDFDKYDGE
jgi:hypothetical protein